MELERERGFLRNLPLHRCLFDAHAPLQETVVPQLPVGPGVDYPRHPAWSYPVGPGRGAHQRVAAAELESRRIFHALPPSLFFLSSCAREKRFVSYATPRPRFPIPFPFLSPPGPAPAPLVFHGLPSQQSVHGAWRWTRRRRRPCTPTTAAAAATTCSRWRRSSARSGCSSASCRSASTSSRRVSARALDLLTRRRRFVVVRFVPLICAPSLLCSYRGDEEPHGQRGGRQRGGDGQRPRRRARARGVHAAQAHPLVLLFRGRRRR